MLPEMERKMENVYNSREDDTTSESSQVIPTERTHTLKSHSKNVFVPEVDIQHVN